MNFTLENVLKNGNLVYQKHVLIKNDVNDVYKVN